jgi:hypothetical protein
MEHTRVCIKFQAVVLAVAEPSDSATREWIVYIQPFAFLWVFVNIPPLCSYEVYCNDSLVCILKHDIPCMCCQLCKFGSDWSIIKVTWKAVCLLSFHWWDFPENSYCALSMHLLQTLNVGSDRSIIRTLCLKSSVSFQLYLGFQWKDFPENSHITHSMRALHTMQVWSWVVSN